MIFELIYTSAPKGLKPGTSGYATVAYTEGMPTTYINLCESLSGYVHLFTNLSDPNYSSNPVAFNHYKFTINNQKISILSRVAPSGTDYSGRANKIAHHIVVPSEECSPAAPASIMSQQDFFIEKWDKEPQLLSKNRIIFPKIDAKNYFAKHWEDYYGDAGIAGILAQRVLNGEKTPSFILFEPGMDVLQLIREAMILLPPEKRWEVTFSTFFNPSIKPLDSDCIWRCCVNDSNVKIIQNALVIDLTKKSIGGQIPEDLELVKCARSGDIPPWLNNKSEEETDTIKFIEDLWKTENKRPTSQKVSASLPQYSKAKNIALSKKETTHFSFYLWLIIVIIIIMFFSYKIFKPEPEKPQKSQVQVSETQDEDARRSNPKEVDTKKDVGENIVQNSKDYKSIDTPTKDIKPLSIHQPHTSTALQNNPNEVSQKNQPPQIVFADRVEEPEVNKIKIKNINPEFKFTFTDFDFENGIFNELFFYDNLGEKIPVTIKNPEQKGISLADILLKDDATDPKKIGTIRKEKGEIYICLENQRFFSIFFRKKNSDISGIIWLQPINIDDSQIIPKGNLYILDFSQLKPLRDFLELIPDIKKLIHGTASLPIGTENEAISLNIVNFKNSKMEMQFDENSKKIMDKRIKEQTKATNESLKNGIKNLINQLNKDKGIDPQKKDEYIKLLETKEILDKNSLLDDTLKKVDELPDQQIKDSIKKIKDNLKIKSNAISSKNLKLENLKLEEL